MACSACRVCNCSFCFLKITSLQPGSSAAEKLAIGDRIMAVNGHEVSTQHSAVTYIRSSGNSVALQVSRPIKPIVTGTSS
ncbi:hypothetical protein niasHT_024531 [Heterodera trifolii]|uniref:PDZ domain-containing protein n=1 Tax=Heterodera trifolii TaxID=157864 RepID=A0ABD2K794_9BILA